MGRACVFNNLPYIIYEYTYLYLHIYLYSHTQIYLNMYVYTSTHFKYTNVYMDMYMYIHTLMQNRDPGSVGIGGRGMRVSEFAEDE